MWTLCVRCYIVLYVVNIVLCIQIEYNIRVCVCLWRAPMIFMHNTPHTGTGPPHTHISCKYINPAAYTYATLWMCLFTYAPLWKWMLYKQFILQFWCSDCSRCSYFCHFFSTTSHTAHTHTSLSNYAVLPSGYSSCSEWEPVNFKEVSPYDTHTTLIR